jgi:hypothetical protein
MKLKKSLQAHILYVEGVLNETGAAVKWLERLVMNQRVLYQSKGFGGLKLKP